MADPPRPDSAASSRGKPPDDRLDSWKDIAAHLKRDVSTVQRWEKKEGMPVHRHLHDKLGSVFASRAELDAWSRSRSPSPVGGDSSEGESNPPLAHPTPAAPAPVPSRRRRVAGLALAGAPASLVPEYALDPAWSPDGRFLVYSGPDVGTTFAVKAVGGDGRPHPLSSLTLTRGARRLAFVPGRAALVVLRGEIAHKDFWLVDLETRSERRLTDLGPEFVVRDFDVSPDGRDIVFDDAQEHSDVVLIDLPPR